MALIGQLKHRATLEKVIRQDNGRGGWTETKKNLGEIWVAQYGITQRLKIEFQKAGLKADTKFMCRFNSEIDRETTIYFRGRRYRIETIENPIENNGYMGLFAVQEETSP